MPHLKGVVSAPPQRLQQFAAVSSHSRVPGVATMKPIGMKRTQYALPFPTVEDKNSLARKHSFFSNSAICCKCRFVKWLYLSAQMIAKVYKVPGRIKEVLQISRYTQATALYTSSLARHGAWLQLLSSQDKTYMANEKWPHGSLSTAILSSLSYLRGVI